METIATLIAYPFDSLEVVDDDGNISYDREVDSETYADLMSVLFSNGVMVDNAHQNALKVAKIDEDTYLLHAGNCVIKGRTGILKEDIQFTIPEETATSYVTSVALKMSDNTDDRNITVKVGIPDNSVDVIGEDMLIVADITTQSNNEREVTDLRFDSSVCGIAHANPYNLDKYEALLNSAINETTAGELNEKIKILNRSFDILTEEITNVENKIKDTGWINCELKSPFEDYGDGSQPLQVRKVGKVVEIRGAVKTTKNLTSSASMGQVITVLDEQFRPDTRVVITAFASGVNIAMFNISPTGEVTLERYLSTKDGTYTTVTNTMWIQLQATYTVGDFLDLETKTFKCEDCGAEFGNQLQLKNHSQTVHAKSTE